MVLGISARLCISQFSTDMVAVQTSELEEILVSLDVW